LPTESTAERSYAKWGKDGGAKYGRAVRDFVKAMKAVDPTIKAIVSVSY
jgi:hypothetical protein